MNKMSPELLKYANEEAIFNLYMYLSHKINPLRFDSFYSIIQKTGYKLSHDKKTSPRDFYRLNILKNAVSSNSALANSVICDMTYSDNGLCGTSFIRPDGSISVVFKGTGKGEWIDNGEGLSGIPESNTYLSYDTKKNILYKETVYDDFASDQQVEALNWFLEIVNKNKWHEKTNITVSGHSKGGNKAQFTALHSRLVNSCFSFHGQGFSPEAIHSAKLRYGAEYEKRRSHIYSISSANDYVNVLGTRLIPKQNIYYINSKNGLHFIESILDTSGKLRPEAPQGKLSLYAENVSAELMSLNPKIRSYAVLGVMNIFQKYLGKGIPVNNDFVSTRKTIAGTGIAISSFLNSLRKNHKDL